nr:ribonuclease H-like domain-containing protein [Tanacetum cinerariifolium]
MEEYMTRTREGYGSGIARPKIKDKDHFELKGTVQGAFVKMSPTLPNRYAGGDLILQGIGGHNGMSTRCRSTKTSDGLAAIQAQLNNLGREIKKVNEKVRNQVDDLKPTIKEGEVINEPMIDIVKTRCDDEIIDGLDDFYNSIMKYKVEYEGKIILGAFMNVPIFVKKFLVVKDFAVVENMDAYRDDGIGDNIIGRLFCRKACVKARRDSPVPTIVVEGVVQPVGRTSVEQKLARRNELKARGTLLMALPDKHQLKFNSHKDAKILMEAIEKRFGGNTETKKRNKADLEEQSLDDLFNSLKIYETKVKHSSSTSTITQNLAFVSSYNTDSTTNPVSAAASDSAIYAKLHVSSLPNVDSLSNDMAMLTMRVRRFLQKIGRNLGANRPTSMCFDMSKVECYNCHKKGHFVRECRYQAEEEPANFALMAFSSLSSSSDKEVPSCSKACSKAYAQLHSQYDKLTDDFHKSQFDVLSYQAGLKSVEARLLVYKQSESIFEENIKLLNIEVQTNKKHGLGYFSSESDYESCSPSSLSDTSQPSGGYHAIPPLITGTFIPPKPDLVFHTAPIAVETDRSAFNVQLSTSKPAQDLSHTNRPSAPIIKDWVSVSEDEFETITTQNVPSFVQSSEQVKTPRHSVKPVETSIPASTPKPTSPKSNSSGKKGTEKLALCARVVNNKQNASLTHKIPLKHMVPAAVLTQYKPVFNADVRPISAAVPKIMVTQLRLAHPTITKSKSPIRRNITRSPSPKTSNSPSRVIAVQALVGNPQYALKDKGVIDSGCSRHMTGSMSYLSDFEELNGGYVAFGGNPKGGKISGKGKIKTCKLDFEDVYFVKELKFNLFSVSQICDKKNSVLFTNTECLVLSPDFKLPDESQVLLRVPRENNMYNVNLKNIVPSGDLTCIFAKATIDESNLWHRRLGHINFKTINKLVKGNLVRGLPQKVFENENTYVACKKGKQHTASCKTKPVSFVDQPLENQLSLKVKVIRSDNRTEFKNHDLNQFCGMKGIKREFNVPRTPQQNGSGPIRSFDIDSLTRTMNYQPVIVGNQTNPNVGFQDKFDAEKAGEENDQQYVIFPIWSSGSSNPQNNDEDSTFDEKEHDIKKPESAVNVSLSSSGQSGKQDDKTKKKAKGKSPVTPEKFSYFK